MKLFSKSLKPAWAFPRPVGKSAWKIWRLLPGSGVLTIELRDLNKKEASFTGLDIETGAPLWQNLQMEDKWWVNINRICNDVLLLQQFVRPDMPKPGKIFAVDIFTGKIIWQNDDVEFLNAVGEKVYALRKKFPVEEVVGLNLRTGLLEGTFSPEDSSWQDLNVPPETEEYMLPLLFDEAEQISPEGLLAAKKSVPAEAQSATLIESQSGKRVTGYHIQLGTDERGTRVYDSYLKVLSQDGEVIFEDKADSKVYTTLQDFYFVVKEKLIYVRNSNEVVAVKL